MSHMLSAEKGTWVLLSFIAFFMVIIAVNGVFIYRALDSNSGVVTDNPYRKGLAYNQFLDDARRQPNIDDQFLFDGGVVQWTLYQPDGMPLEAEVTARFVRPVKEGLDFETALTPTAPGVYNVTPAWPVKGQWRVHMKARWNKKQYQTQHVLIVP